MNQYREWDGICQGCFNSSADYTMSMFDVALICLDCAEKEKKQFKNSQKNIIHNLNADHQKYIE